MRSKLAIVLAGAGALFAAPLWAHHAFTSEFDPNQPVKLRGVVSKMEWINPHAWLHLDVKDESGKVSEWMIECGTPNTLLRRGVTKRSVMPGIEVVVEGYRSKDGQNKANGRDVTFTDGRKLFLGSQDTGAPDDKKQ